VERGQVDIKRGVASSVCKTLGLPINEFIAAGLSEIPRTFKITLRQANPALAAQWHPTKNLPLMPDKVVATSFTKVWWICPKNHEWQARIRDRDQGSGCHYCAGKIVWPGHCFANNNPELSAQWHPTKNLPLMPDMVFSSSRKRVWWQCSKNHQWQATIRYRKSESNCPYCVGQIVLSRNCLKNKNPDLAAQWHPTKNAPLTAADVMTGTNQKVWWICKNNHQWQAQISSRNQGYGCPYCSGRYAFANHNLKDNNPSLAAQWHPTKNKPLTPADIKPGSTKKVWWLCRNNHQWQAAVSQRVKGTRCPYCAGRKVSKENSLLKRNPRLAREWDYGKNAPLRPTDVTCGSGKKVWWVCKHSHHWETSIYNRRGYGVGCPYCRHKKASPEHCLQSKNPALAAQWHPNNNGSLTPSDVTPNSSKKVWWICRLEHSWQSRIFSRNRLGCGCPFCSGRLKWHRQKPKPKVMDGSKWLRLI
jgi:hypothetical protein